MATISFKVTADEALRIRRLARRARCSVSEFLRQRAMSDTMPKHGAASDYRVITSTVTGLPVMHGPRDTLVTSEQVRSLLVDFP